MTPIIFLIEGFSPKIKKATKSPKGTSACTNNVAEEASTIFNPEYVKEYWIVHPIKAIKKICLKYFLGKGKNQNIIKPDKDQRKPFKRIGGKNSIAGFEITNPKPIITGTKTTIKTWR